MCRIYYNCIKIKKVRVPEEEISGALLCKNNLNRDFKKANPMSIPKHI